MKDRKKSLIKNTTILSFGMLCTKGITFITTPLFTRWLSQVEYGTFDLMVTYITLLIPIVTLSSGEAVFRFILDETDSKNNSRVISTAFIIDLIGILVTIGIGLGYSLFVGKHLLVTLSFLFFFIMEVFFKFVMMILRGEKRLDLYALGNIIYVLGFAICVTIFVFFLKWGLCGILIGYACGDIIAIGSILILSKRRFLIDIRKVSKETLRKILEYSLPLIPNDISWWIMNASDRTIITFFMGAGSNAIYAVASKIPVVCTHFFNVFGLSWQQNAIETMEDGDRDDYYSLVINNMFRVVSSVCILVLSVNYFFYKVLFTKDYFSGCYHTPILIIATIFSVLGQFIGGIYVAQMNVKKNSVTTVMAACINILVNIMLIGKIGIYAASISTLIAYITLFLVRYVDIKKEINLKFDRLNIIVVFILAYYFASAYILWYPLQLVNIVLAIIFVCTLNKEHIKKIIEQLKKKV